MKTFKVVVLALSGMALFYACASRLINPTDAIFLQSYFENPDNSLAIHKDLANEIRAEGGVMLFGGIIALIGAIRWDFRLVSFVITTVIFGGVILGRSLGLTIDGVPHPAIIRAAIAEGVLFAFNILCLLDVLIKGSKASGAK
ncbi:MAG: DUF4345 domain-containing protein [Bacteroidia bacterium]|nr:DUF4345 domain-containing protein [Bacteroidia bacterium]